MNRRNTLALLGVCLSLAVAPAHAASSQDETSAIAPADAQGAITGVVSNAATGAYLEGARVRLTPGNAAVLTTRGGQFIIPRVPPGDYQLTVEYTGLDPATISVRVTRGTTAVDEVRLTSDVYELAPFAVEGEREGNALAITQQRNAPNIKNVISADAFGNVADLNVGNFLQRLPGFSTEISEGEVVRVQIRGTNADLNAVSIDGTRAASGSTRTFARGFEIDKIPADFIETVEVTKAATPDIDADSIGGAVNLRTKSALDFKGRRISYQYGYNYNVAQKTFRPSGNAGYANVFMDGKLGLLITGSYNKTDQPRDANGITWQSGTDLTQPVWFNADTFGSDKVTHTRGGLSSRLDYKVGEFTRLYFSAQYSYYADTMDRHWGRLSTPTAAKIVSVTKSTVETVDQTFSFFQYNRDRDVTTKNFTFGGDTTFWGGKLDFNANYSTSKGTDLDRTHPIRYVDGVGFRQERSANRKFISLTQISGPDILDWRNSRFSQLEKRDMVSRDQITGAQVNFTKPLDGSIPFKLKSGLRYRGQKRSQDLFLNLYSYVGPNGVPGPYGPDNDDDLGRLFDPDYDYEPNSSQPKNGGLDLSGQFFDLNKLDAAFKSNPEYFARNVVNSTRDSIRSDNRVKEDVTSAYIMGDAQLGRLGVVGGLRLEATSVTGHGFKQEVTPEEKARRAAWVGPLTPEETARRTVAEFANPITRKGDYRDLFPSVHFKYEIADGFYARASFSTGIGRPSFGSIVPTTNINNETLTITANNPDLEPQYGKNYDVSLEYYFKPAGLLSASLFQKDLSNFIFRQSTGALGADNPFGPEYEGYTFTTDLNGGSARIRGLELSYQQQFSNLPGFWKGFGVFANLTFQETEGDYGSAGSITTEDDLPNFSPRNGNVGVTYSTHPWTVRVQASYSGTRLLAYSADPSQKQYLFSAMPIDVSVSYAFSRSLRVYMDVINVFNEGRQYQYRYVPERRSDTWVYTPIVKFGLSGSF